MDVLTVWLPRPTIEYCSAMVGSNVPFVNPSTEMHWAYNRERASEMRKLLLRHGCAIPTQRSQTERCVEWPKVSSRIGSGVRLLECKHTGDRSVVTVLYNRS